MDDLFESFDKPRLGSSRERRKHLRKACFIEANYMVQGRWYKGSLQNISEGGAYISSIRGERFLPGEKIFLVARITVLRDQLRGKIAWTGPLGMGIEFQSQELDYGESQAALGGGSLS
jgi:hypothetical protein